MRHVWIAICILLMAGLGTHRVLATADSPFAMVPFSDPAYSRVDIMQRAGLVIGYPDGTYSGRLLMTRYQFGVSVARLTHVMLLDPALWDGKPADLAAAQADIDTKLVNQPAALAALRDLVQEFQPELVRLGQNMGDIGSHLSKLVAQVGPLPLLPLKATPFRDVPRSHWAYGAVETVRQAGIVQGYPGGSY